MVEIKHKSTPIEKTEALKKAFGKKVIAKNGSLVGYVGEVYIHPKRLTLEAIRIDKSLTFENHIGKNYIKSITEEGVILKITPITEYIGNIVLDKTGKKVGKVKGVRRSKKTNKILSIIIGRGITKDDLMVTTKFIDQIDKKVLLNTKIE